jgi:uncharacterized protein (TIGR02391 family)
MTIPSLDEGVLQSLSDVLGHTTDGLSGRKLGQFLRECRIPDPYPTVSKRDRLFAALQEKQASDRCGNNVAAFLQHAMSPARYHSDHEWFETTRARLNHVLAFAGYQLHEDGKLREVAKAATHMQAAARASKLREHLLLRKVHSDVLLYCREELLVDNYFHAVFEATKSVAEKIRQRSGLTSDGAELVDQAFSLKSGIPYLALNKLTTESEQSEQKGFMNLLKGLFGTFRNTTAHAPKITWKIDEQDALDILSLVSLVHRRLDAAIAARAMYEGRVVG